MEYEHENNTKKIILASSIDSTPSLMEVIHNDNEHSIDCDDSSTEISESSDRFDTVYDQLTEDEIAETELLMNEWFEEYIEEHITSYSSPKFHDQMVDYVTLMLYDMWIEAGLCIPANYDDIREWTNEIAEVYYTQSTIPPRSLFHDELNSVYIEKQSLEETEFVLETLKSQYQPKQKTAEWYEFRHNILTASSIWKALGSEAQFNSLVYEKCKPFDRELSDRIESAGVVNNSNPMNWGVKYEPLSVQIYEKLYHTRVDDFGCLIHPKYPYVGASPDGINVDRSNTELYGRMIEVKNIVNREINGIPLEAYWIQMQLQMEVCNLDTCDFIETRFEEFDSEIDFYVYENPHDHAYYKGVILYFIPKSTLFQDANPIEESATLVEVAKYVYMPLDAALDKSSIESWILSQKLENSSLVLYHTIYWKLSEFSCVFVPRNKVWFESIRNKIQLCWDTIERERVEGYEHRAAQSRKKVVQPTQVIQLDDNEQTHVIKNLPVSKSICLVKLDS